MKKILIIAILILASCKLFAQIRNRAQAPVPPPVPLREVSGLVKDATGQTVIGATITLQSKHDTVRTATNADGIFVLKNIKEATFTITIDGIGYVKSIRKYLNNDAVKKIVLDPVVLKTENNMLNEVKINGTPSIVYKPDTVEYRASDYKVRANATVDELLKKMEGMEVGSDGTLTHQGQQVTKAKLNGKDYAGGDVAQAIQNLPADIVEKIQVVDDYGDQAARTGVKDGDPQKILNITTRADRSVGTTGRIISQAGNNDRYNEQLFVQRINANQQLGIIGNLRSTVTGIAGSSGGGGNGGGGGGAGGNGGTSSSGNPGTTKSGAPSFNYRDQWSKKVQVIASYGYNFNNNNSTSQTYGQRYTSIGTSDFNNQGTTKANRTGHNARFQIEDSIDSTNFLQITPTFSYSNSTGLTNSTADNVNNYTTGFEHEVVSGSQSTLNTSTNYGLTGFYLHLFKKPRRNISLQASVTQQNTVANGGTDNDYRFYADSTHNNLIRDSTANLLNNKKNKNTAYDMTLTYVEPLSKQSVLEFRGDWRQSKNNTSNTQDTVLANGQLKDLTSLDQIYNYTTTQGRLSAGYHLNGSKVTLVVGAQAIPYNLSGTKVNSSTSQNVSTSRSTFKVIPNFSFAYAWSRTERIQVRYTGAYQEPNFLYLQPFTDRSDPDNLKVGNPNLTPSFNNSVNAQYNNYIPNSKVNLSFGATASTVDNSIAPNTLQVRVPLTVDPLDPTKNKYRNINETHYVNLDGEQSVSGNYNISKQLDDRRYNLALNGSIGYSYSPAMSNGVLYHTTNWTFNERFGPRINPTDNIEVNPYISYNLDRSFTNALHAVPTMLKTTKLAIDGRMYFFKTFQINYSASKNFVSGIANYNTNPLVINAGFQKEFLEKRNLVLTFDVYDLLHQNNFIQQTVTPQGVTNTISSSLSRYFLIGVRFNLQKWSGTPTRNGRQMMRRGDGSFIY